MDRDRRQRTAHERRSPRRTLVFVDLFATRPVVLAVRDRGPGPNGAEARLGVQLVGQVVEHAMHGTFSLGREPDGPTVARVEFPAQPDAHPAR